MSERRLSSRQLRPCPGTEAQPWRSSWAQSIVFFSGGAADYMQEVSWIYKLHIFIGLTIILLFPFSRLVHVWSVPFGYVTRRYQLVRRRA